MRKVLIIKKNFQAALLTRFAKSSKRSEQIEKMYSLYRLGIQLFSEDEFSQAEKVFREILYKWKPQLRNELTYKDNIVLGSVCYNLGVVLRIQGQLDKAINEYENAIKTYRELPEQEKTQSPDVANTLANAYIGISFVWLIRGQPITAITVVQQALEDTIRNFLKPSILAKIYDLLGIALQIKGELNEAIKYHERVIKLEKSIPSDELVGYYINFGQAFYLKGCFDDAIAKYTRF